MDDYGDKTIKRALFKGIQVGAYITSPNQEDIILDVDELQKFRELLAKTSQKLSNAYITADGLIVPHDNSKIVEDVNVSPKDIMKLTSGTSNPNLESSKEPVKYFFPQDNPNCSLPKIRLWVGKENKNKEENSVFIEINDFEFYKTMHDTEFLLSQEDLLEKIDRAKIVNVKKLKIETPYGIDGIDALSTGLKTALNVFYKIQKFKSKKFCVNLSECGNEVINLIFEKYTESNVSFYISRSFIVKDFLINYARYIINEIVPNSYDDLVKIMCGKGLIQIG
jgi:hypothetical protein